MLFPLRRILLRWLQLAAAVSACCLLVWVAVQQLWRQDANDPQVQMARDAAARLAAGQAPVDTVVPTTTVDVASSLAPFLTVLDARGSIVASSGRVHGALRSVPSGVLDHVRQSGEEEVSWQPEAGVRVATAIVSYPGGFVLTGRSLVESERRIARMGELVALAWLGILAGLAVLVTATETMIPGGTP
jgi:hypothetical protein